MSRKQARLKVFAFFSHINLSGIWSYKYKTVWNNTVIWRCLGGSGGCNHRPTWCHYTHYTVKINAKIHITPSSIMPEGTSKVQNAVKYDPMIHISPSSMIPWYTLHLQVWSHDTHYTVKHEPMIHITPSSMNPWYTLHRQAWSHDTHYTVKHEPMIHITPSSMNIRYKLRLQALDIALREARNFF